MAITLGTVTFDERHTTVQEKHEETGGRDARKIAITGMILGEASVEAIEARLDSILDAASESGLAALSLRPGRRLWVRRMAFSREVAHGPLAGSFTLQLEAPDPFEESLAVHETDWAITASGDMIELAASGNAASRTVIEITATGRLVNPSVSDGSATLVYEGIVEAGHTLVMDGVQSRVLLDGEDVTPYTSGTFPRIAPEGTILTYRDDASSAHACEAVVSYRDRWW